MAMKVHVVRKILIGIILSAIPIIGLIEGGVEASCILPMLFVIVWNVGEVYAAPYYLKKVENKLTSILKLAFISYLSSGRNTIMAVALIAYIVYVAAFGWITGWILLIREIAP